MLSQRSLSCEPPAARTSHGLSLVELLIALAILAMVFVWTAPNFSNFLRNIRARAAAESVLAGLQQAKAEAVSRNTTVRFQLTSSLESNCTLTTSGTAWVVDLARGSGAAGNCHTTPSDATDPFILAKSEPTSNSAAIGILAEFDPAPSPNTTPTSITLTALGRPTFTAAANMRYTVFQGNVDNCRHRGGAVTCLQVIVSTGGRIRMCDPALDAPNPQAC